MTPQAPPAVTMLLAPQPPTYWWPRHTNQSQQQPPGGEPANQRLGKCRQILGQEATGFGTVWKVPAHGRPVTAEVSGPIGTLSVPYHVRGGRVAITI